MTGAPAPMPAAVDAGEDRQARSARPPRRGRAHAAAQGARKGSRRRVLGHPRHVARAPAPADGAERSREHAEPRGRERAGPQRYRAADDTDINAIATYARRPHREVGAFLMDPCVLRDRIGSSIACQATAPISDLLAELVAREFSVLRRPSRPISRWRAVAPAFSGGANAPCVAPGPGTRNDSFMEAGNPNLSPPRSGSTRRTRRRRRLLGRCADRHRLNVVDRFRGALASRRRLGGGYEQDLVRPHMGGPRAIDAHAGRPVLSRVRRPLRPAQRQEPAQRIDPPITCGQARALGVRRCAAVCSCAVQGMSGASPRCTTPVAFISPCPDHGSGPCADRSGPETVRRLASSGRHRTVWTSTPSRSGWSPTRIASITAPRRVFADRVLTQASVLRRCPGPCGASSRGCARPSRKGGRARRRGSSLATSGAASAT